MTLQLKKIFCLENYNFNNIFHLFLIFLTEKTHLTEYQHFKMLFRNLIYTGITRARKLAVFVGTRRALGMAVGNQDISRRQTALQALLTK